MSDLSRLLDDVYCSGAPTAAPSSPPAAVPAPVPTPAPEAPAWASDEALDDAFADWVPGPPDEAPEQERAFAEFSNLLDMDEVETDDDVVKDRVLDDDELASLEQLAELSAPTADETPAPAPAPVAPPAPATAQLDQLQALLDEAARLASLLGHMKVGASAPAPADDVVFDAEPAVTDVEPLEPFVEPEPQPAPFALPEPVLFTADRPWRLEDDDILPIRGIRRGLSLSLRRRK